MEKIQNLLGSINEEPLRIECVNHQVLKLEEAERRGAEF